MDPLFLVSNRRILPALLCLICALVSQAVAQGTGDKACDAPTGTGSESTCVCQTDAGKVIDLTPLSRSDGKAKFTVKDKTYSYNYNPCTTFTDGTKCSDVYICQHALSGSATYTVASLNEKIFKDTTSTGQNAGKYYVHYIGPENRNIKVYLNCDQSQCDGELKSITQPDDQDYVLQLFSCHACAGGCTSTCPPSGGGGKKPVPPGIVGIVLMIVIIISLVAYFIIGALLMKFHFQASGSDVVPNKTFWIQLPLLIKDGFVFTFGPCFKCIGEKTGMRNDYQKI